MAENCTQVYWKIVNIHEKYCNILEKDKIVVLTDHM